MSRVYRIFGLLLLCLPVLALPPCASAQSAIPTEGIGSVQPAAQPPTPSGADRRVTIDISATDGKGTPTPGLAQQDFTLLDNKKPVKLLSFQAFGSAQTPARPTAVILVVDAINLKFEYVGYAHQELDTFLRQNEGRLAAPTSIFEVSDTDLNGLSNPSTDGNAVASALDRYQNGLRALNRSGGFYGAEERLQMSMQKFMNIVAYAAKLPGRKLLIWIGPGWPMLGGPAIVWPPKTEREFFNTIVQMSAVMRQNNITLDSISAGIPGPQTFYYQSFLKGVKSPNDVDSANLDEKVMAVESGGIVIQPNFDLPGDIQKCIDTASVFYRVSFDAPPTEKPNQYHSLVVKMDRHGLKAYTNTGYYDQP